MEPIIDSNVTLYETDRKMLDLFLAMQHTQSPETARTYRSTLERFMQWAGKPMREITLSDLIQYQQECLSHLKPTTQRRMITTIRSWFTFLSSHPGYLIANPTVGFKPTKVEQNEEIERVLTRAEIERIRDVLRYRNPRNHLIVSFLFATGLRLSELCNARWCDIRTDLDGNIGLRVVGKGKKVRVVKLTKRIFNALVEYRQSVGLNCEIGSGDDSPLFVNRNGEPLSPRYIEAMFTDAVKRARINKPATVHWLRHSTASHALHNGADLLKVQQQLGHSSLNITQRYLHSLDRLNDTASDYIEMDMD
jgi:integrase/recombinase XerD